MKRVVSVSLGSKKRDHQCEVELLGERVEISRRGTDGDLKAAVALLRELDGKVDAFGMGGIDRYLFAGKRRYEIRDAMRLVEAARVTPIVDGSGLKNTLGTGDRPLPAKGDGSHVGGQAGPPGLRGRPVRHGRSL